ncbi:NAD(P)-binding protein [Marasmius fiardii PR-910]|nr:NAD(P)-binding protein [Marasmius fiardii PR-910]
MAPSSFTNGTSKTSPRVALVTGAAQGMGRTIAERLFQDGYKVALNDISVKTDLLEEVAEELGGSSVMMKENGNGHGGKHGSKRVLVVAADVSVEEEVKGMVDKVVEEFGSLDVMIANAGIATIKPFEDTTTEMLDRILAVNVRGTFLCYKYASQQMIKQGHGGRIIGASSIAGKRGQGNLCAYSASKFAIRGLTQSAAVEFGKHGITVNAYAPGGVVTEMFESMPTKMKESLVARASLGTLGKTKDIASLVSFIVSDEARFITGQTITIDGGIHFD